MKKRMTKRKGNHVYINTEVIPRKWCKGESGFMMCQYQNNCSSVAERTCPFLMVLDKLADYEDREKSIVELFAEIEKIICKYSIDEYSKETGVFIRTSYNGNAIAKALTELKNKYTKEGATE